MRHSTLIFLLLTPILLGCSDDLTPFVMKNNTTEDRSNCSFYSPEEAVNIANSITLELDNSTSRVSMRSASLKNVFYYNHNSRASQDSLLYIVNYDNDEGFALISRKRCEAPVLAVINSGAFDQEAADNNFGFTNYITNAIAYINELPPITVTDSSTWEKFDTIPHGGGLIPATKHKVYNDTTENITILPKTKWLKWGQRDPEGLLCPNGYSGCGPTAMAVIITSLKNMDKSIVKYTYQDRDIDQEEVDWSMIGMHEDEDNCKYVCNPIQHRTIARICRQLGELSRADYSDPESTSTYVDYYPAAFKYFIPNSIISNSLSLDTNGYNIVKAVKEGLCLMYASEFEVDSHGNKGKMINDSGHSWVVDGCYYLRYYETYCHKDAGDSDWVIDKRIEHGYNMISVNWGWNGKYNTAQTFNGFYHYTLLNPGKISPNQYFEARYYTIKLSK